MRACHLCVGRGAASPLPRRKRACEDRQLPFASSTRDDDARKEEADGKEECLVEILPVPMAWKSHPLMGSRAERRK